MPVYAFRCRRCGHEYESFVTKMGETAPCPACGDRKPERLLSIIAALFGRGPRASSSGTCPPRRRSGFG